MKLRSLLFLPGNSPGMLLNGTVLEADALILDLEDAVAPEQKDAARKLLVEAMRSLDFGERKVVIRINACDTEFWEADLEALVPLRPFAIMPPKVSSADYLQPLLERLDELENRHQIPLGSIQLIPLLETAAGVASAREIALSSARNLALFLGAEDYTADIGASRTQGGAEIFLARSQIVLAAKSAGIGAIDTPFTDAQDLAGLKADAELAKSLGFTAKASISPHHLAGIHEVFSPKSEEISYALEVLECLDRGIKAGQGAVSLRGKMIDKPIELRALRTLSMASDLGLLDAGQSKFFDEYQNEQLRS
ncbi:MAG: CoA ester lyase [Eubacteriales bacterium]|nr:CoA ester lyase [Eubacteriales bacterium]